MRLLLIFVVLAILVLVPFFLWGEGLISLFSQKGTIAWLGQYGQWAWLVGIILLMGDLVLPLPSTLIMSGLGYLHGALVGGLISACGTFLAGAAGYWLCRLMGEGTARKLLGGADYERGQKWSSGIGVWVVILSRWLPVFPEVIACMAGLVRMPVLNFHLALLCASIPLGFTYAYLGYAGVSNLNLAVVISVVLPPVVWLTVRPIFKSRLEASPMLPKGRNED